MLQDQHLIQLERVLREAECATDCRIHLVFQKTAPGYIIVSLILAALVTLLVSLVLLAVVASNTAFVLTAQFVCFSGCFAICYYSNLKYKLTPDFFKQTLAHYSLGQVLNRMNAESNKANVLVMVSQLETFAKVIPSQTVADQVPATVWTAINNSLMIDVGHGEGAKGLKNSTSAITKLLKVYFPKSTKSDLTDLSSNSLNRLEIHA